MNCFFFCAQCDKMSHDFRYNDPENIIFEPPKVGGLHSWDQENEIRHFFLSTRFCLLAAMRFGRPKKETRKGTRPLLCHMRTSPTKKEKNATILFPFSASVFCLCLAFFCFFAGERNASGLPRLFLSFLFLFCKGTVQMGSNISNACKHTQFPPPFFGQYWAFFACNDKKITNYLANVWLQCN